MSKLWKIDPYWYKEPPRAKRRRIKENVTRRAIKYIQQNNMWFPLPYEEVIAEACRRADNFQVCSCHMCGNPRRDFWTCADERMTVQERKAWIDMKQQYEELGIKLPRKRPGKLNGRQV